MKRGLMTYAGLGLSCLSDGGGNNVYQAQSEWVGCLLLSRKTLILLALFIACVLPCVRCMDFDIWASQIFCLGAFPA